MPYHGIRPCKCGKYRGWRLVRDCGRTGIVRCVRCGKEKRVKWSLYVRIENLKKADGCK